MDETHDPDRGRRAARARRARGDPRGRVPRDPRRPRRGGPRAPRRRGGRGGDRDRPSDARHDRGRAAAPQPGADAGRGPDRADRVHRRRQPDGGDQHRPDLPLRPQAVGPERAAGGGAPGRRAVAARPGERPAARRAGAGLQRAPARGRRRAARSRPSFDKLVGAETGLRGAVEPGPQGPRRRHQRAAARARPAPARSSSPALIHDSGARRTRPFVAQNCGALPETLLESRAVRPRARRLHRRHRRARRASSRRPTAAPSSSTRSARRSPAMQLRLLRVLQEGEVRRVGGSDDRARWTCGVIAATNADLEADVSRRAGSARDLYYRLNVFPIRLPPLRERAEDIPPLAEHFLRQACRRGRRAVPAVGAARPSSLLRGVPLAGQRARAGERDRARGGPGRRRPAHSAPRTSRSASRPARAPPRRCARSTRRWKPSSAG